MARIEDIKIKDLFQSTEASNSVIFKAMDVKKFIAPMVLRMSLNIYRFYGKTNLEGILNKGQN